MDAAPAAPAAPVTNGATAPAAAAPQQPKPAAARAKDGTFLPKDGQGDAVHRLPEDPRVREERDAEAGVTEKKEEEELFEYKVNGKMQKLTRAQALVRLQKSEAADQRFQEAADTKRRAEELLALIEKDPEAALAKAGRDPAKVLEEYLSRKAREATLTPEQKEHEQLKRQLEEYKAKAEKADADQRSAAQKAMDERTSTQLEETLLGAAAQYGLDRTPATLELLADVALELVEYGINPTPDQLCQEVIHRQKEHIGARDSKIISKLSDDKLMEHLGPEVVKRIVAASLKSVPKPGARSAPRAPAEETPAKGYLTEAELERSLGLRR